MATVAGAAGADLGFTATATGTVTSVDSGALAIILGEPVQQNDVAGTAGADLSLTASAVGLVTVLATAGADLGFIATAAGSSFIPANGLGGHAHGPDHHPHGDVIHRTSTPAGRVDLAGQADGSVTYHLDQTGGAVRTGGHPGGSVTHDDDAVPGAIT